MTKWDLANMLFGKGAQTVAIFGSNGLAHIGIVTEVEREDGSGRSFNITMTDAKGAQITFHAKTKD